MIWMQPALMASKVAVTDPKSKKKGNKSVTTSRMSRADVDVILRWLEMGNKHKIHGAEKATQVSGKTPTKTEGYKELAVYFNSCRVNSKGFVPLTPKSIQNQWQYYFNKYRKLKQCIMAETGYGVTDEDRERGIVTIDQKNDDLCPYYERMDSLYGEDANVVAFGLFESGIGDSGGHFSWAESDADVGDSLDTNVDNQLDYPSSEQVYTLSNFNNHKLYSIHFN
jgi:hypothetical protein